MEEGMPIFLVAMAVQGMVTTVGESMVDTMAAGGMAFIHIMDSVIRPFLSTGKLAWIPIQENM